MGNQLVKVLGWVHVRVYILIHYAKRTIPLHVPKPFDLLS